MARATTAPRTSAIATLWSVTAMNLRRLRRDAGVLGPLLSVVLLTSLLLSAAPQLFNQMSDDALRTMLDDAPAVVRNISIGQLTYIPPAAGDDVFANVDQEGADFQADLPASIQEIIGQRLYVVDSPRYTVTDMPGQFTSSFPRFLRFRYQQDIDGNIQLVDGRLPQPREPQEVADPETGEIELLPVIEFAASQETLNQIGLTIGSQIILRPDGDDQLYRGVPLSLLDYALIAEVSGIIQPSDLEEPFWYSDPQLHRAQVVENPDFVLIYAMGLLGPDDYTRLLAQTQPAHWRYAWRLFVDSERVDAGGLPTLAADIRNQEVLYGSLATAASFEPTFSTGLSRLFNRYLGQRRVAISSLSLISIGLLAIAGAVTAVLAALIAERRRDATLLARARGATGRQLGLATVTEGLLLTLPTAFLGYLLVVLFVGGRASPWSIVAFVGVAVAAALLLLLAASPLLRRDLGALQSRHDVPARASARRVVFEFFIAGLAVAGVILLRRRGLSSDTLSGMDGEFDPYLAAVPVLVGLAVGLLTLRLYPLPIRLLSWLGGLRRDLVIFLGARRVSQQPPAARLPILVILLAVAVAVFASVVRLTIDDWQQEAAWQLVGADYAIDSGASGTPLYSGVDLSGVEEIDASAEAYINNEINLATEPPTPGAVSFAAIDTVAYTAVTDETRGAPNFPEVMLQEQLIQDIGTPNNPIPAVVSSNWLADRALQSGETFTLDLGTLPATFVVRDVRERFLGLPVNQPFVVAPLQSVQALNQDRPVRPTRLYMRGGEEDGEAILTALRSQSVSTDFASRYEEYNDIHDSPFVKGVLRAFQLTVVLAGLYAALAAVAALALTSRARARDFGYLRTLGLSTGQAVWLTIIEQLPPLIIAATLGSVLGVGIAQLVEPGLNLVVFVDDVLPVTLLIDWPVIIAIAVGLTVLVGVAIGIFSYLARQENLGQVLRVGE